MLLLNRHAMCLLAASTLAGIVVAVRAVTAAPANAESTPVEDIGEVFTAGMADYFAFRIPALLVTKQGTVLTVAEGRPKSTADVGGNDLVLRRSVDGGRTWSPLTVIAEDGPRSLNTPCLVQDRRTGRIILFYHKYPEGTREHSLPAGSSDPKSLRAMMLTNDDDGQTWSSPTDITDQVKRPTVTFFSTGPGVGIQLRRGPHAGRIIMATNQREGKKSGDLFSIYSDDGGRSWAFGQTAPNPTEKGYGNEVQAVELADGRVMLNARNVGGNKVRKITTSADGG